MFDVHASRLNDVCSGLTISLQTIDSSAVSMCVSSLATPLPVHALLTTTYTNGVQSTYYDYVLNDASTISSMSTMSQGIAVADPLYVAWEASDLSLFPVAYATSLAQKIGVAFTPTATPVSGSTSRDSSQTGSAGSPSQSNTSAASISAGLSSAARIGIGVGVGVGTFLLFALIAMAFVIRRLRRRNLAANTYPIVGSPTVGSDTGLMKDNAPGELDSVPNPGELDSAPLHVVPGSPVELDASHTR